MTTMTDHDLTQALFQACLARQTTATLRQMQAMLQRANTSRADTALRLVEAELARRASAEATP